MKNYTLNLVKLLFLVWLFLASTIQSIWAQKITKPSFDSNWVYALIHTEKPKKQQQLSDKVIYNQFEKLVAYQAIMKSAQTLELWLNIWFATFKKT